MATHSRWAGQSRHMGRACRNNTASNCTGQNGKQATVLPCNGGRNKGTPARAVLRSAPVARIHCNKTSKAGGVLYKYVPETQQGVWAPQTGRPSASAGVHTGGNSDTMCVVSSTPSWQWGQRRASRAGAATCPCLRPPNGSRCAAAPAPPAGAAAAALPPSQADVCPVREAPG